MCLYQSVLTTKLKLIWNMCCGHNLIWTQERLRSSTSSSSVTELEVETHDLESVSWLHSKPRFLARMFPVGFMDPSCPIFFHPKYGRCKSAFCAGWGARTWRFAHARAACATRWRGRRPATITACRDLDTWILSLTSSQFALVMIRFKVDIIWKRIWPLKVKSKVSPNFTTNDLISERKLLQDWDGESEAEEELESNDGKATANQVGTVLISCLSTSVMVSMNACACNI